MADLGLKKIRFMTNNPKKVAGLEGYGLEIVEWVPLPVKPNPHNQRYLQTKAEKLGHLLPGDIGTEPQNLAVTQEMADPEEGNLPVQPEQD